MASRRSSIGCKTARRRPLNVFVWWAAWHPNSPFWLPTRDLFWRSRMNFGPCDATPAANNKNNTHTHTQQHTHTHTHTYPHTHTTTPTHTHTHTLTHMAATVVTDRSEGRCCSRRSTNVRSSLFSCLLTVIVRTLVNDLLTCLISYWPG